MTQPGTRSSVVICSRQTASDSGGTVSMSLNTAPAELTAQTLQQPVPNSEPPVWPGSYHWLYDSVAG